MKLIIKKLDKTKTRPKTTVQPTMRTSFSPAIHTQMEDSPEKIHSGQHDHTCSTMTMKYQAAPREVKAVLMKSRNTSSSSNIFDTNSYCV